MVFACAQDPDSLCFVVGVILLLGHCLILSCGVECCCVVVAFSFLSTLPLFQLKMDNFRTAFAGYDDQDDFVEDDFHLRVR